MAKDVQQGCSQDCPQTSSEINAENWPGYARLRPGEWKTNVQWKADKAYVTMIPKDAINPGHYRGHPSGVECIRITEHMNFCLGNALKYIWRAGLKDDKVQDLNKAKWYIEREIKRIENDKA